MLYLVRHLVEWTLKSVRRYFGSRNRTAARCSPNPAKEAVGSGTLVGDGFFVEIFAQRSPADRMFSFEERMEALDRAADAAGLNGFVHMSDFDVLYRCYRKEIELLRSRERSSEGYTKH